MPQWLGLFWIPLQIPGVDLKLPNKEILCDRDFKSFEFTGKCQTWWLESTGMMITKISNPITGSWGWFELSKQGNLCYRAFKSFEFTRKHQIWWLESIGMMTTIISDPIASPWGWSKLSK